METNACHVQDSKYYVYQHIDPVSGEIVYIGKGVNSRAYDSNKRHIDHKVFMDSCLNNDLQFVFLIHKLLDNETALNLEKELILKFQPKFNKMLTDSYHKNHGLKLKNAWSDGKFKSRTLDFSGTKNNMSKLTEQDIVNIRNLKNDSMSYRQIKDYLNLNVTPQTIGKIIRNERWENNVTTTIQ
jgi:hypothetical protein